MASSRLRVLVIEDHIDIAANVGDYLESKNHTVDFAYDGNAGLELATNNEYDALIVDLSLPGIGGLLL